MSGINININQWFQDGIEEVVCNHVKKLHKSKVKSDQYIHTEVDSAEDGYLDIRCTISTTGKWNPCFEKVESYSIAEVLKIVLDSVE